jgi:acetolactate synthase-1/2/3 large subunit
VYNNSGWNAVRMATLDQHPEGDSAADDVPESKFAPTFDLSHAAHVVDAHTEVVEEAGRLYGALREAATAVDDGLPAVLDVRIEPI